MNDDPIPNRNEAKDKKTSFANMNVFSLEVLPELMRSYRARFTLTEEAPSEASNREFLITELQPEVLNREASLSKEVERPLSSSECVESLKQKLIDCIRTEIESRSFYINYRDPLSISHVYNIDIFLGTKILSGEYNFAGNCVPIGTELLFMLKEIDEIKKMGFQVGFVSIPDTGTQNADFHFDDINFIDLGTVNHFYLAFKHHNFSDLLILDATRSNYFRGSPTFIGTASELKKDIKHMLHDGKYLYRGAHKTVLSFVNNERIKQYISLKRGSLDEFTNMLFNAWYGKNMNPSLSDHLKY